MSSSGPGEQAQAESGDHFGKLDEARDIPCASGKLGDVDAGGGDMQGHDEAETKPQDTAVG